MKKAWIFVFIFLLCGLVGQAFASLENNMETGIGQYINERYGFALSWMPGNFTITESDNGDGIRIADSKMGMEIRAFGTHGWDVMGKDFDAGVQEECGKFDMLFMKRINKEKGWFALSGYKGDDVLHIKGYYTPEEVCEFSMHYPIEDQDIFAEFAQGAFDSFRKIDADGNNVFDRILMNMVTVNVEDGVDEHGCNSFQLRANENLTLTFRKAVFNEEDYSLAPGEILSKISLKERESCLFKALIPEGVPNLMVCADEVCWTPGFSGEDGSLVVSAGFEQFSPNDEMSEPVTQIHLPPSMF